MAEDTYTITLKDGTLIQDIPRSMKPEDVLDAWHRTQAVPREEMRRRADVGMEAKQQQVAGEAGPVAAYQQGAANLGRNLLQMALPKSVEDMVTKAAKNVPDFPLLPDFSEEGQGDFERRNVASQRAFPKSHLAGEVVPSLVAPGSRLPSSLAAGATMGAALSGPESRGQGAGVGGMIGGLTHGLARTMGRTAKGTVKTTPEAQYLQKQGLAVPLSQAADDAAGGMSTMAKSTYEHLLPFFPTARAALDKSKTALRTRATGMAAGKVDEYEREAFQLAFDEVMDAPLTQKSNIMFRNWFYALGNFLGPVLSMGTLGAFRGMATPGFQKFLMGSTKWQGVIQKALKAGDEAGVQRAIGQAIRASAVADVTD